MTNAQLLAGVEALYQRIWRRAMSLRSKGVLSVTAEQQGAAAAVAMSEVGWKARLPQH